MPKMVLHLFGNYIFPFFDKSFSYTGFEVGKMLLFCIRNTRIITILFIQKLSNHGNQISKTKIWTIAILHSSYPNSGIQYASISESSKVENLGLFNLFFSITVANILIAKCHVTSVVFGIRWIAVKSFLVRIIQYGSPLLSYYLLLSLSYSGNLTFQSFSCHKTILVQFSKKLHLFPQISRHNQTAITAEKKKTAIPRLAV